MIVPKMGVEKISQWKNENRRKEKANKKKRHGKKGWPTQSHERYSNMTERRYRRGGMRVCDTQKMVA